jgi:hypothetical protein
MTARVVLERVEPTAVAWWVHDDGQVDRLDPAGHGLTDWTWGNRGADLVAGAETLARRIVAELGLFDPAALTRVTVAVCDRLLAVDAAAPVAGFDVVDVVAAVVDDIDLFTTAAGYRRTRWGWERLDAPARHVDRLVDVTRLRPLAEAMLAELADAGLCAAEAGVDPALCAPVDTTAGWPTDDGGGAELPVWRFPDADTLPAGTAARWCNALSLHPFDLWDDPADRAALVWAWPPARWVDTLDHLEHRRPR